MTTPAPEPAGFGHCKVCAYRDVGPSSTCWKCARETMTPIQQGSCPICDQRLPDGGHCINALCQPGADRHFEWTLAIALKDGPLERAIWKLKDGFTGWGIIFGRVVLEQLLRLEQLADIGMVIPMPAYLEPGQTARDHASLVIHQAAEHDDGGLVPFVYDPPVIVKTRETPKLKSATAARRREIAGEIYEALQVPDPSRVDGQVVMVYDDVFTRGTTLNVVARKLKEAGARAVLGLTLARQPWK